MPRIHTIWNAEEQKQEDIPFTPFEELARDNEEAAALEQAIITRGLEARLNALHQRLGDDGFSHQELLEMLRLERGI